MRYLCVFSLLSKTVPCKIYLRLGILDLHEGKRMNTFSPILYVEGLDALIHSLHTSSCWLSIPLFHLGKVREWCVFFMLSPKKDFKRSTSIGKAFIEWTTFCRSNTQFEPFSKFSEIQVSFSMYCATSRICSATPDDMDGLLFSLILCFNNKDSNGPLNSPPLSHWITFLVQYSKNMSCIILLTSFLVLQGTEHQ